MRVKLLPCLIKWGPTPSGLPEPCNECENCVTNERRARARARRRERESVLRSYGLTKVRGAVSGRTYWE